MINEHEDAAREALSHNPMTRNLYDRVCDAMREHNLSPGSSYHAFMVGRYVGEMLERGEYRGLTPDEVTAFEAEYNIKIPVRERTKSFSLDKDEWDKAKEWMQIVDPPPGPDDLPKHGPIGGALTFSFTDTTIGQVKKVIFLSGTPKEKILDLTDYESW